MLGVIQRVLDDLHQAGVRYCHWKSNVRIAQSLQGQTDMDILVDSCQRGVFLEILYRHGFKHVHSPFWQTYPCIEDYIGFDAETGKLTHFHMHYELVLGEPMLKSYRLPWEAPLLAERVLDSENRVYIAAPHWEMLLLLVRWALKLGRDVPGGSLRGQSKWASYVEEYDWLIARLDPAQVVACAQRELGDEVGQWVAQLLQGEPTGEALKQLRHALRPRLARYRRLTGIERWGQLRMRRGMHRLARSRLGRWGLVPSKKTFPSGGRIIALVGIDGSGKSTLAHEIVRWLGWKLDAHYLYLGHGAGRGSLLTEFIKRILRGRRRTVNQPKGVPSHPKASLPSGKQSGIKHWMRGILYALLALSIARDRWRKIRKARRLRDRGAIVVTDRWIQASAYRMDCPMFPELMERYPFLSRWAQPLARYEQRLYHQMADCAPDLVIRLHIAPETALQRKDDLTLATAELKAQRVHTLEFTNNPPLVEVDAEPPLETVLLEVKRALWQHL